MATFELGRFIAAGLVTLAHLIAVVNVVFAVPGHPIFGGWAPAALLPLNPEGVIVYTGELAVQYFFVLSGFVMMTAHAGDFGKPKAALKFWWRRACRIYPVYWLAVAVAFFAGDTVLPLWKHALETLLLAPWQTNFIIFPAWSLRFELAFYAMFGLGLLPRIGKPILLLWLAVCIVCWLFVDRWKARRRSRTLFIACSRPQIATGLSRRWNFIFSPGWRPERSLRARGPARWSAPY